MGIDAMGADLELPLERPLFTPTVKPRLAELQVLAAEEEIDTARPVRPESWSTRQRLRASVQRALRNEPQVTLRELLETEPLLQGLAELVAYLELAHAGTEGGGADGVRALVDETEDGIDPVAIAATRRKSRWYAQARVPRVIFTR
jgi:hypothetical protein